MAKQKVSAAKCDSEMVSAAKVWTYQIRSLIHSCLIRYITLVVGKFIMSTYHDTALCRNLTDMTFV